MLTRDEETEIAATFIVANTPTSFQRWLERSPAVIRVSRKLSENELLDQIQQNLRAKKTEMTIARAYAYLVALTLVRQRTGTLGAMPIRRDALRWAQRMWDFAKRRHTSTSMLRLGDSESTGISRIETSQVPGSPVGILDEHGHLYRRGD